MTNGNILLSLSRNFSTRLANCGKRTGRASLPIRRFAGFGPKFPAPNAVHGSYGKQKNAAAGRFGAALSVP